MERIKLNGEIEQGSDLIMRAFKNSFLVDMDGNKIESAVMIAAYLKIYCQTPHEQTETGQVKPNDNARVVEISPMDGGDWLNFHAYRNFSFPPDYSQRSINKLWVHDDTLENDPLLLEDYLRFFYGNWFYDGYSIGFSPIGLFDTGKSSMVEGIVYGRSLQLDLESPKERVGQTIIELQKRFNNTADTIGFVTSSSPTGTHFFGHAYEIHGPEGKVNLASKIGSALLLNREGKPNEFDGRSGGHQLRSLSEDLSTYDHPIKNNSEIGSLRAVRSLIKPTQPVLEFTTPIQNT